MWSCRKSQSAGKSQSNAQKFPESNLWGSTNENKTLRHPEWLTTPRVLLLWTDLPAVAAGPGCGWHPSTIKGNGSIKEWNDNPKGADMSPQQAEVIPRNPAPGNRGHPVSSRSECLIYRNMNVKAWVDGGLKLVAIKRPWGGRGARVSWKWIPLGRSWESVAPPLQTHTSNTSGQRRPAALPNLQGGKWERHKHILRSIR